jgi:oligoendopeptidase F
MQTRHFAAVTGINDAHIWDMPLPEAGLTVPRMTFEQTRIEALAALAPLGATYVEHFRQLLDPANRRLDVDVEQGKRTNGGFSIRAPGVPTGLFVENYSSGVLGDSRTVIHEGGHAIHGQLMIENGISPFYTRGPNWMFEAFATLNEFLLYDHLYQTTKDPRVKAYYLRALIDDMAFSIFGSAEEATLEQSIYDGVVTGTIKNAADLDALTLSIWSRYEIWPASDPQLAHYWITRALMVQDPLYQVNYLYAGTLAIKIFDLAKYDPTAFQKRYMTLLRETI